MVFLLGMSIWFMFHCLKACEKGLKFWCTVFVFLFSTLLTTTTIICKTRDYDWVVHNFLATVFY